MEGSYDCHGRVNSHPFVSLFLLKYLFDPIENNEEFGLEINEILREGFNVVEK